MSIDLNRFLVWAMWPMSILVDNDIQKVSGHCSKLFSTFCTFAGVFSMQKTFSVVRTNWKKAAQVVNKCIVKSDHDQFIKEFNESRLTLVTFNGFALFKYKKIKSKIWWILQSRCQLKICNKKAVYFEMFYFVNFSVGHKTDGSFFISIFVFFCRKIG